ncbi:B3 domain-containing protein Os01g0723500-like [Curcuma longa]|uniref:B3 domain-containing protein Os01g0723500-like n=1 Tax=Curcuma longa TaxID=136217 RepID=UPI003D9E9ADD
MMPNKKRKSCSMIRKPHFFKVLVGDFAHALEIPQNFMKNISDEESKSKAAVLHGPGGGNWQVEVCSTGQEATLLLGAGWHSFVKDHSLEEFQFLVFQYDGEMHFTVLVFSMNGCERTDLFAMKSPSEDAGNIVEVTTEDEHESRDVEIQTSTSRKKGYVSTRRVVTEEERRKAEKGAEKAANSFTSPHPYCIKRMSARNAYGKVALKLPARFSRAHMLRTRRKIVLRDPNGKAWVVTFIPKGKDSDIFSAGWAAFARGNNLEEGDYCVFELFRQIEMQVHIFRVTQHIFPITGKRKMFDAQP